MEMAVTRTKSVSSVEDDAHNVTQVEPSQKSNLLEVDLIKSKRRPTMAPSIIIPKSERPDWLKNDEVIDQYDLKEASSLCAQYKMIAAMERQTNMQVEKEIKAMSVVRPDQDIKPVMVLAGEDNVTTRLHPQSFVLQLPLTKPETYWELFPVRWPQAKKMIQLAHLGLDQVLAARVVELMQDRSDSSITIKGSCKYHVIIFSKKNDTRPPLCDHSDHYG